MYTDRYRKAILKGFNMLKTITLCLLLALSFNANAKKPLKQLRCGTGLVKLGMNEDQVYNKCGHEQPSDVQYLTNVFGTIHYTKLIFESETKFTKIITLRNGRVWLIEKSNRGR